MKRTLYIGLLTLTAALFTGCSTESYPGLSYEGGAEPTNDETLDNDDAVGTPVRVYVNEQTFYSITGGAASRQQDMDMTRGVGSFQILNDQDIVNKWSQLSDEEKMLIKQKYERSNFYIYAFRAKEQLQPNPDAPDFRRYNLVDETNPNGHAPSPSYADTKDRWHCLVDGQDYYKGLLANLEMTQEDNGAMFNLKTKLKPDGSGDRQVIYYPDRGDVGYNFFAYSVGDISTDDFSTTDKTVDWGQCDRREDQVVYRNFTVDGSQDIMAGYAPPIEYALSAAPNLTDSEKDQIKDFGYCTFAAHRGIDPMINLHHEMTRIRFRGAAGDESSQHTAIHSIRVRCYNKGDFVVAHRDTNQVGFHPYTQSTDMLNEIFVHDRSELALDEDGKLQLIQSKPHDTEGLDEEGKPLVDRDDSWHVDWKDWDYKNGGYNKYEDPVHPNVVTGKVDLEERLKDAVTFGDDLLVPPSDSVDIYIRSYYRNKVKQGATEEESQYDVRSFTSHYVIKAADIVKRNPDLEPKYLDDKHYKATGEKRYIFKPGYYYTITLVVYGLSPIKVYANIDAWQEGDEDIHVGEDDFDISF